MEYFVMVYGISMLINLIIFRVAIRLGKTKTGVENTFMVFFPVANTFVAVILLVVGFFLFLFWISNGTTDTFKS